MIDYLILLCTQYRLTLYHVATILQASLLVVGSKVRRDWVMCQSLAMMS